MKNKILILAGDPNSINSEIIFKVWRKTSIPIKNKLYLIANYNLIKKQLKILKSRISLVKVKKLNEKLQTKKLKIIDIPLEFKNPFNVSLKNSKQYITKSLNLAHKLAEKKEVKGFINCPFTYSDLIFMFQKELAERIVGKFNTTKYGRLSILTNYKLRIIKKFSVSPNCFFPVPKVDSTVLFFKPNKKIFFKIKKLENLEKITNVLFSNKRKMINKNIKKILSKNQLNLIKDLNLSSRPSELQPDIYYKITELFEKN
ncbi:hypothetical protein N9305_01655 [Pelagibacteraceae bacterium]|nr:hypothetical protein [Pelagibacteraceae bacterium]